LKGSKCKGLGSAIAEAVRLSHKREDLDIEQLKAKTLTPCVRISKVNSYNNNSAYNKQLSNFKNKSFNRSEEPKRLSPKKQLTHEEPWLFRSKLRPSAIQTTRLRRKSISPWEIDLSPY